jgi:C1A family cysteine protease
MSGTVLQSKALMNRPRLDIHNIRKYCYKRPQHVDYVNADFHPRLSVAQAQALPSSVDLSPKMMPCYAQLGIGACASNVGAAAMQYDMIRQGLDVFMPSRLYLYWNARNLNRTVDSDSGSTLHEVTQVLTTLGICPESEWPYDTDRFTDKPPQVCYDDAQKCKALHVRWVPQDINSIKGVLASGLPVTIGIMAFSSIESATVAKTGVIPMPQKSDKFMGGHALLLVGYDDATQMLKARNSWSPAWGSEGYGFLPYSYALDSTLAAELGTVSSIS